MTLCWRVTATVCVDFVQRFVLHRTLSQLAGQSCRTPCTMPLLPRVDLPFAKRRRQQTVQCAAEDNMCFLRDGATQTDSQTTACRPPMTAFGSITQVCWQLPPILVIEWRQVCWRRTMACGFLLVQRDWRSSIPSPNLVERGTR